MSKGQSVYWIAAALKFFSLVGVVRLTIAPVGTALAAVRSDTAGARKGPPFGINRCIKIILRFLKKDVDKRRYRWYYVQAVSDPWEHSSAGRASALQAEGHRFEPCCSHQRRRQHSFAPVAQLVEQRIENPRVVGSTPTGGTTESSLSLIPFCGRSSSGRAPPCQGGGSEFEPRRPLQLPFFSGMDPNGGIRFLFFIAYTSFCFTSVNAVQRFFCFYLEICGNIQFRCLEFNKIDNVRHFH